MFATAAIYLLLTYPKHLKNFPLLFLHGPITHEFLSSTGSFLDVILGDVARYSLRCGLVEVLARGGLHCRFESFFDFGGEFWVHGGNWRRKLRVERAEDLTKP